MPHFQIRISAASVSTVRIPARAVHSHGIGDVDASTNVDTDAGIAGWGEAAPWTVFTGSPEGSAAALHVHLRPLLLGADPFRIEALLSAAERTVMRCPEAKAAMEMALFDIIGKTLGFSDQRAALVAITAALDTPVMADESVFTAGDALLVAGQHMADLISIKLQKSGGMLRAREIAAIAAAGGLACYGGDMFETGIACTAGAHPIAATPNISLGCELYQPTYHLLTRPFPVRDGMVQVPTGPGLDTDVDENPLRRYAI